MGLSGPSSSELARTFPISERTRRIRLTVGYRGTAYAGWAAQPRHQTAGRDTVQAVLERALAQSLAHPCQVSAAGRTDAGVHAEGQVITVDTASPIPAAGLQRVLAQYLPDDVWVVAAREVEPGFDARRSALRRWYRYAVWRGDSPPLAWRGRSLAVPHPLDAAAMRRAAWSLVGRRDLRAFATSWTRDTRPWRTPTRTIYAADWLGTDREPLLTFEVCADAFLRGMVRSIVGSLLQVGLGTWTPRRFAEALSSCDRRAAGPSAPAHGLTLWLIEYPNHASEPG
jgi:tRNA pseudouridine38-40 synthase